MYATVRTADRQGLSRDKELTVAIAKVNPNYVSFLMDNFLNWKIAYYDSVEAAFQAVADGEADAGLLNDYRINRLLDLLTNNGLSALNDIDNRKKDNISCIR